MKGLPLDKERRRFLNHAFSLGTLAWLTPVILTVSAKKGYAQLSGNRNYQGSGGGQGIGRGQGNGGGQGRGGEAKETAAVKETEAIEDEGLVLISVILQPQEYMNCRS